MDKEVSRMIRLASATSAERPATDKMEPAEFAREVRRLAIDAYKALTYPDVSGDELARLKHRSQALLGQIRASRAIEMTKWLCSVNRAIDVRLRYENKVGHREHLADVAKAGASCDELAVPLIRLFAVPECDAQKNAWPPRRGGGQAQGELRSPAPVRGLSRVSSTRRDSTPAEGRL
jgi:hypothetical protein